VRLWVALMLTSGAPGAAREPTPSSAAFGVLPDGGVALSPKELLRRLDEMKDQLKDRPKTAEIEFALGNLYYDNARWPDAIDYYRQLLERAEKPLQRYLALRSRVPAVQKIGQARCPAAQSATFDDLVAAAERQERAGKLAAAARCYEVGLLPVAIAMTRQGNAWYLVGNNELAAAAHRRALALTPDDPDSLFFLGAILFEEGDGNVAQLRQAKGYWERYLQVAGESDPDRSQLVKRDLARLQAGIENQGRIPREAAK
jgi:tetratricopeptide (TPR) repeat protein